MPANQELPSILRHSPEEFDDRSRDELYQRARKLGVKGASRMKKAELAEAIARNA